MVTKVSIFILLVALNLHGAQCNLYTISDDRVRNMDITPVLGRGYSIMTNMYHSTCLMVDETTVPSFNYDYFVDKYTSTDSNSNEVKTGKGKTDNFEKVTAALQDSEFQLVTTTMSIERYYSSLKESASPLSSDAKELLNRQDYVGFFKACGPTYVRSIRRAQDVFAMLQFKSSSQENSSRYASSFEKKGIKWYSVLLGGTDSSGSSDNSSRFKQESSSLKITITGTGLGLSQEGSEALVATTVDEYGQVMKFAFKTMTQLYGDTIHVGMVFGMEVAPWVNNLSFQTESKLHDENVVVPMPRSLIQRAYGEVFDDRNLPWTNNVSTRNRMRCVSLNYVIDKYGYCCELEQLYDIVNEEYRTPDNFDPTIDVCRPLRVLDPNVIRDNLSNNGEFVARLDGAIRYKLVMMGTLERCISDSNSIPDSHLDYVLKPLDTVKYARVITYKISLRELRLGLDPMGDYGLLRHMANEMDEWVEMFYAPCYAALYGANVGVTPDVEVSYFMAYPWYTHEECLKLSCVTNNMRWDRKNGGCVPGLFNGNDARAYESAAEETNCAKDPDINDGVEEVCKYTRDSLNSTATSMQTCWDDLHVGNIDYLVNNYCMPEIESFTVPEDSHTRDIRSKYNSCRAMTS